MTAFALLLMLQQVQFNSELFFATNNFNLCFFVSVKPSLSISSVPAPSSSTPSAVSFVPRHVTLKDKVSLPVVAIVVSSVVIALSVIAVVTLLLLRKRRPFTGEWRVRGYQRHSLNEWETSVSIKTWEFWHCGFLLGTSSKSSVHVHNSRYNQTQHVMLLSKCHEIPIRKVLYMVLHSFALWENLNLSDSQRRQWKQQHAGNEWYWALTTSDKNA